MDVNQFFINFRKPSCFYYAGDDYIESYKLKKKQIEKLDVFDHISIYNLQPGQFRDILDQTGEEPEIGIILNSAHFIFNILEFDRLPLRENLKRDLIEWRIKKVFPEEIDQYEHHYFQLSKTRILSVLLKRELKSKIESVVRETNRSLIYLGNSTVEIINDVFRGKDAPDFFLEIDKHLSIVVFQNHSIPYYIRKFRIEKGDDVMEELSKTLRYVSSSYGESPKTYSLVSNMSDSSQRGIREELEARELKEITLANRGGLFLPILP
ncbi:MAG: hypothetical protein KAT17_05910 [Candidatus Aminicenantes bacterium]|nr:hypothetical protein [Candidatus Aminicenantes bacterium]